MVTFSPAGAAAPVVLPYLSRMNFTTTYPSLFDRADLDQLIARIDRLDADTQPGWGKMNAAQMLAHNSVAFDISYGRRSGGGNFITRLMMKWLVRPTVIGDKPYQKNGPTGPAFVVRDDRDFGKEKAELIANLEQVHADGAAYFEGREQEAFGVLTAREWNRMFVKHLDHHLRQFGV